LVEKRHDRDRSPSNSIKSFSGRGVYSPKYIQTAQKSLNSPNSSVANLNRTFTNTSNDIDDDYGYILPHSSSFSQSFPSKNDNKPLLSLNRRGTASISSSSHGRMGSCSPPVHLRCGSISQTCSPIMSLKKIPIPSSPSGGSALLGGTARRKISSSSMQGDFYVGRNESKKSTASSAFSVAESKALSQQLVKLLKERQQRKQQNHKLQQRGFSSEKQIVTSSQDQSQHNEQHRPTDSSCDYTLIQISPAPSLELN